MITGFIYALGIPLMAGGNFPPLTPEVKEQFAQENADENSYTHEVLESTIDSVKREEHHWHIRLNPSKYDYHPFLRAIGECKDLHTAQQALLNAGFFLPKKVPVVANDITARFYNGERAMLPDYFLRFLACYRKDQQDGTNTQAEIHGYTSAYENLKTLFVERKGFGSFFADSLTGKVLTCGILEAATLYGMLHMYAPEKSAGLYAALVSTVGITMGAAWRALKSQHRVSNKLIDIWKTMTATKDGKFTEAIEDHGKYSFMIPLNQNNVTHLTIDALNINLID